MKTNLHFLKCPLQNNAVLAVLIVICHCAFGEMEHLRLHELIEESDFVGIGHIEISLDSQARSSIDGNSASFIVNEVIKAPEGTSSQLELCMPPDDPTYTHDEIPAWEHYGRVVLFADLEDMCWVPHTGYLSVIRLSDDDVLMGPIEGEPDKTTLVEFVLRARQLIDSRK